MRFIPLRLLLPKGYKYTSPGEVRGPKGSVYYLIGRDVDGNPVYFNNKKFISFEGGVKKDLTANPARIEFNGEHLHPNLPEPVMGYDYKPKQITPDRTDVSDANINSHINGYVHEIKLANAVAERPNTQVIKWGDKPGRHGSDVISVNTKTGEVELWDSKYRSNPTKGEISPTFDVDAKTAKGKPSDAFSKTIQEAKDEIAKSKMLSPEIKIKALRNLEGVNFKTYTVGSGKVKHSVIQEYCKGKKC